MQCIRDASRFDDFLAGIDTCDFNFDTLCICETWRGDDCESWTPTLGHKLFISRSSTHRGVGIGIGRKFAFEMSHVHFQNYSDSVCALHAPIFNVKFQFFSVHFPIFPERRFVAGFFRRLLAYLTPHISHTYLTPHISHTYPSHHTYPTHIHSKRIHSKRIPPLHIPPIRICSTRIPPVRTHAMRIHSKRLHQQVLQYVSHQYVSHQYVSVQHVSHQYVSMLCVSIQKVCISRNRKRIPPIHFPPIRIFNTYPTSTDPFNAYPFKKFASAGMAMSMSIIAYHFIPLLLGGNGNEYRNLAFPSISLQNY